MKITMPVVFLMPLGCYHSDDDENKKDGRCDEEKI